MAWTKTVIDSPVQALNSLLDNNLLANYLVMFAVLLVSWWLYVPIHELMHALACFLVGGEVTELAIDSIYGGGLLAHIFPFVVSESDYAGQLTGFTVPNKFAYFVVDLFPYLLSLPGLLLIRLAVKFRYAWLFSLGLVLMFVPLTQVFGDFYEAASLAGGELMHLLDSELNPDAIVSDDMFKLVSELQSHSTTDVKVYCFVAISFVLGLLLAWLLVIVQVPIANFFIQRPS